MPQDVNKTSFREEDLVMEKMNLPIIFNYTDYRLFLQDFYKAMKASTSYFSFRYFASRAGLSSGSFLKLVMEGKRNLSEKTMQQFAHGLGMKGDEEEYFKTMVKMNQASVDSDKHHYFRELLQLRWQQTLRKDPQLLERVARWVEDGINLLDNCGLINDDVSIFEIEGMLKGGVERNTIQRVISERRKGHFDSLVL
jgi:uncharacterized protein (TIGR02147 family)